MLERVAVGQEDEETMRKELGLSEAGYEVDEQQALEAELFGGASVTVTKGSDAG